MDLVVRKEGGLYRVVRSRFHGAGDLLTAAEYALTRTRTSTAKILVLPETGVA